MSATRAPEVVRRRLRVQGVVQGVGFRPFVYRLARELELGGLVRNDERGVVIEIEGSSGAVGAFAARLRADPPPLARIDGVRTAAVPVAGEREFRIEASAAGGQVRAEISPDTATCADCLRELLSPADRRHRYPFINCTACGPRFTIVRGVPYDRARTTMAGFPMCTDCRAEYENPLDRRFHAEPNACPACGPRLVLTDAAAQPLHSEAALAGAVAALRAGAIVAIKGLGGFHLACLAGDEHAVARLRARKHRAYKPFALMAGSVEAARTLVALSEAEARLLGSRERPIVLAPRCPGAPVAAAVAPGLGRLGVMLPYSPLHHLLMHDLGEPLVMTSGNVSDEPIAFRDEEARERLAGIADLLLGHDRPIQTRTDDSVLSCTASGRPLVLRRSRGFVPDSLPLPVAAPRPVLACGAQQKSTFCVARDGRAWVSHHIGELENYETLASFAEGVERLQELLALAPALLVHDLHPDYLSTRYALARASASDGGLPVLSVQHHHAHLAACLAEHGERGPALGAVFDGTGHGADGTVWGGELLLGDLRGFARVGHVWPVRMPGGEQAVREPWRMACAWLQAAGLDAAAGPPPGLAGTVSPAAWASVARLAQTGVASPLTTSAGRLFDAIAALCGVRPIAGYEGQAAIELEDVCDSGETGAYPVVVAEREGRLVIDARPAVVGAAGEVGAGVAVGRVATRFHHGLADATVAALVQLAAAHGVEVAALAGGCFANRVLLERVRAGLCGSGLRVLIPERLPPGDGAISYGQAAVAAAVTAEDRARV